MAKHLQFGGSSRTTNTVIGVTLALIGAIVYFSPLGRHHGPGGPQIHVVRKQMPRSATSGAPTTKHLTVTALHTSRPLDVVTTKTVAYANKHYQYVASARAAAAAAAHNPGSVRVTCATFQWQQDAQRVYLANLSDPYGLDSAKGPYNGNGIACDRLPTDPSRTTSKPADPFAWGAGDVPSKQALLHPAKKYYGLAKDGLPGDYGLFDAVDTTAGRAPNMVEWFENFGQPYPAQKVNDAWARGALPVITWMSAPAGYSHVEDLSNFSLKSIAQGKQDATIHRFAGYLAAQRLPVVIRFDHENNGNWYPWSVGWRKQGITDNSATYYVKAWQRVHTIFEHSGANAYAIWAYVPSRIDSLGTFATGYGSQAAIVQASYPGDAYVDWVGADAYQYDPTESRTFHQTFDATLALLGRVTSKPILVAEMGSSDGVAPKAEWIRQTYAGLAADRRVIGAIYFDNDVTGVHYIDGKPVHTDWRFTTSSAALIAFRDSVSSGAYGAGVYPPYLHPDGAQR